MANSLSWNNIQIKDHTLAAKELGLIKDEVARYIGSNKDVYEKDVVDLVIRSYKKHGLINDEKKEQCIAAFRENTSQVHYFAKGKGKKIQSGSLILLDIWARLDKNNSPYADMTWMFFVGKKIPNEIKQKWSILSKARDTAVSYIKKEIRKGKMPRGLDIDRVSHDIIGDASFGNSIRHTIGHSLGLKHPHGDIPGINWREYSPIIKNVGYTIEPGMYFKDIGMRTEIDFYISDQKKIVVTTPIQKDIDIINI